jgi:hypothetical protein
VRLLTMTPDYCGMTRRDVELARQISAKARELGLPASTSLAPSANEAVQKRAARSSPTTRQSSTPPLVWNWCGPISSDIS